MGNDFTVIEAVRHHFGDNPSGEDVPYRESLDQWEAGEPFVGISHDFPFDCPSVDSSQMAVLQFNAFAVSARTNIIRVNGVDVPGGMYLTPSIPQLGAEDKSVPLWHTQSLLITSGILQEKGNALHIESTTTIFRLFDDFIIDNVVIFFKLKSPDGTSRPGAGQIKQ